MTRESGTLRWFQPREAKAGLLPSFICLSRALHRSSSPHFKFPFLIAVIACDHMSRKHTPVNRRSLVTTPPIFTSSDWRRFGRTVGKEYHVAAIDKTPHTPPPASHYAPLKMKEVDLCASLKSTMPAWPTP